MFKVLASLGLLSNKIITSESPQTVAAWHRNVINVYYYYLNAFQTLCYIFKGTGMNKARSLPFPTGPGDKQVIQCDLQWDGDMLWEYRGGWESQRGLPGGRHT